MVGLRGAIVPAGLGLGLDLGSQIVDGSGHTVATWVPSRVPPSNVRPRVSALGLLQQGQVCRLGGWRSRDTPCAAGGV